MLNTATAFTGHLLAHATDHSVLAAPYCPASRNDIWKTISPAVDIIVGDVIGLKPLIIAVIVTLAVVLAIGSFIPRIRQFCLPALGWVVGAAIFSGVVITVASTLVDNVGCK